MFNANMYEIVFCFLCALLANTLMQINCGKCPQNGELIKPCVCENSTFYCYSDENFNLKRTFEYASRGVDHWYDKKYKKLHIKNPELTKLVENAFFDIVFEEIVIDGSQKLRKIHMNALGATRMHTKKLSITDSNALNVIPPYYNLFDALCAIPNLELIEIKNSNITEIPYFAFRPLMGQQWNLKELIILGPIQRINDFAFYDMPYWMRNITIGNQVNFITAHAFDMRSSSYETLVINLSDNLLTITGFESGVFTNSKRPLYLNFARNKITYLDEEIFYPIISRDILNRIDLEGNALECNCHMRWLFENKLRFEKQVINGVCVDGTPLWSHKLVEVGQCSDPINVDAILKDYNLTVSFTTSDSNETSNTVQ